MSRLVTFTIKIDANGDAIIAMPEGKQEDAQAVAGLTETLAKRMGRIKERHQGEWKNGVHFHRKADGSIETHSHE